ncbi:MAG: ATPase, T2SS/T4P/T4SS family [Calditrichaceae bacterium]
MKVQKANNFKDKWLVEALLYYQIIEPEFYDELVQRNPEESYISDVLISNNFLSAEELSLFLEKALKIHTLNLDQVDIDHDIMKLIPEEVCRKHLLIPLQMNRKHVAIASFNPSDLDAEKEIEYLTGKYVKTYFAFREQILEKINRFYSPEKFIDSFMDKSKEKSKVKISGEKDSNSESPIIKLVNQILSEAVREDASDIHIEPKEEDVVVRLRIDGVLRNLLEVPRSLHAQLISRIKIISNLDIAETRKPQDGKSKIKIDNAEIDLRVSILPTNFGEKVVIRILDKRKTAMSFEKLGIHGYNRDRLEDCFGFKQGMVLVTGPTGSGKSTTLYAAINRLRSTTNNILTIEDPIEYMLEGINQVQVNEKAGITFATALRSFLRQDPDVILVGEIRDKETAETSIQAALTGHLVLSTLHTNDTFTTITRLKDMGIDKFKITESLGGIIAQRLVRKLCDHCKVEVQPEHVDPKLIYLINQLGHDAHFHEAKGCARCGFNGYKGRIGIYEILILNNDIKEMIANDIPIQNIRKAARDDGFRNLFEDALSLIADGITDYNEILRVVNPGSDQFDGQSVSSPETGIMPDETDKKTEKEDNKKNLKNKNVSKNILVVEDTRVTRMMIKGIIEKKTKWTVSEAEDGAIALKNIQQNIPDLILLDIMMPNMDGYEFLQHLRSDIKTAGIPVLMLTALKTPENEIKVLELGADDFLTKPINPDVLIARIKRKLDD